MYREVRPAFLRQLLHSQPDTVPSSCCSRAYHFRASSQHTSTQTSDSTPPQISGDCRHRKQMAKAAFIAWLKHQGAYVSPKLDLFGAGVGGDRSVRALADVDEGERLLLVPESSTITMGAKADDASRCVAWRFHEALSTRAQI
jgi:hypothetical protein